MTLSADKLSAIGEWFAAGYMEKRDQAPLSAWARAWRRWLEHVRVEYEGGSLAPSGTMRMASAGKALKPDKSFTFKVNLDALAKMSERGVDADLLTDYRTMLEGIQATLLHIRAPHYVGGSGFTHSIPNYGRVLREGLDTHARRIRDGLAKARLDGDTARVDFYESLLDLLEGIRAWHANLLASVEAAPPSPDRDALLAALRRVPFAPARTFREAVVAYNVTFYLDLCDNPGRMDRELLPFYEADLAAGRITRDEARGLLRAFTDNVCDNDGWSAAIGGSLPDGAPAYNDLTTLCLEAVAGKFRPSYELAVRPDMPDALWETALDTLATGCGQPAFYNDALYMKSLRGLDLGVSDNDLCLWNGGGCTETMIHGCSNVGSLDAGINTACVLDETLHDVLPTAATFDDVLRAFKDNLRATVADVTDQISAIQQSRAKHQPQPMRSLLIDDCIDRGEDFNARGARYRWSVVNVAGLTNCADALAALREVVFERGELSGVELLAMLDADFADAEPFRQRLLRCPRFGNDDPTVDDLAADITEFTWSELRARTPWRGGRFLPSCIMFTTYARAGQNVGALPDGRHALEPLGDSVGPVTGRDRTGPTAMLRSVLRLPLHLAAGTPVLNVRFSRSLFESADGRRAVRDLVRTYLEGGGMQMQVTVVDQAVLRDAMEHPEKHEDLIVRIGGFSTFFNRLDDGLKRAVIARTEHTVS